MARLTAWEWPKSGDRRIGRHLPSNSQSPPPRSGGGRGWGPHGAVVPAKRRALRRPCHLERSERPQPLETPRFLVAALLGMTRENRPTKKRPAVRPGEGRRRKGGNAASNSSQRLRRTAGVNGLLVHELFVLANGALALA